MKIKNILTVIAFLLTIVSTAQVNAKVYLLQENGQNKIYADNDEVCEVSVVLSYNLTNMKTVNDAKKNVIIPAQTKKFEINEVVAIDPKKATKFSYSSTTILGNIFLTKYDKDFKYFLPFKTGSSYKLDQGYNGAFSHKNENALDFVMPIGTEITAVRGGIVVQLVNKNSLGCKERTCMEYNNYMRILHDDGTFSEYAHFKKNGNLVKVGDSVKQGDVILLSGNTGFSSGPHLHLVIYKPTATVRETLPTNFLVGDGKTSQLLKEKETYARNY